MNAAAQKMSSFQGFQVENAVCGGCHTMVQARPIPGFSGDNGNEDEFNLPNGQHLEEINSEARRRHRQEKLPPLASHSSQDLEAEDQPRLEAENEQEDAEKILTIEQVEEDPSTIEAKENEKNTKKGTWHAERQSAKITGLFILLIFNIPVHCVIKCLILEYSNTKMGTFINS